MAERILKLHLFGVQTELAHIPDDASVQLEFSDPTDDDPIEWVNVHVRSSALPSIVETHPVDLDNDGTIEPLGFGREMIPRSEGGPAAEEEVELAADEEEIILEPGDLLLNYDDVTKAQLQDILRDKDLPTSGSKQTLIDRLNEDALDN